MTCEGCANPESGIVMSDCRACKVRDLARGPLFFNSMRAGKLLPDYRLALRALGDEAEAHEAVKAAAKQFHTGAIRA